MITRPALWLLRSAINHSGSRETLILTIRVAWGSALELVPDRLSRALASSSAGALRDR